MDKKRLLELAGIVENVSWGRLERGEYGEHIDLMAAHVVAMAHEDMDAGSHDAAGQSDIKTFADENLKQMIADIAEAVSRNL